MALEKKKRDYIAECIALRTFNAEEIATMFGKGNRLAQRMRRAGQALHENEKLRKEVMSLPLRDILQKAEASIKGKEYDYANT